MRVVQLFLPYLFELDLLVDKFAIRANIWLLSASFYDYVVGIHVVVCRPATNVYWISAARCEV